jgi:hypothetical protein
VASLTEAERDKNETPSFLSIVASLTEAERDKNEKECPDQSPFAVSINRRASSTACMSDR